MRFMQPSWQHPGHSQPPASATDVATPAVLLMAAAGAVMAYALLSVVATVLTATKPDWVVDLIGEPSLRSAVKEGLEAQAKRGLFLQLLYPLWMLAGNAFIVWGALQLRGLRNYPLAMAAAVLSAVPCVFNSCCCVASVPVGVFALAVLLKPEVKAAFR